jgi:hypothetical protein
VPSVLLERSCLKSTSRLVKASKIKATVNQQPPAHHEGWMVSGEVTVFCWVPVP